MWPFDSRLNVVRVGAGRVEHWACTGQGLMRSAQECLPPGARQGVAGPDELRQAMRKLLTAGSPGRAHLVLESAWLPVLLLDTGSLWSSAPLEALLRHRLSQLFDVPGHPGVFWQVMLEHRPGERHALGYGLAVEIRQALVDAGADAGVRWASLQPALAWGRQRLRDRRVRDGWWVWGEQDRSLVCHLVGGRVDALNAGAPALGDVPDWRRALEVERFRFGVEAEIGPVVLAGWEAPAAQSASGMTWASVGGDPPEQPAVRNLQAQAAA